MKYFFFNTKINWWVIGSFMLFFSCSKKERNGYRTETPLPFSEVELHSSFHVALQEDSIYFIEIQGNQEIINGINILSTDSILTLEDPRKSEWRTPQVNKVKVIIHSPPLKKVTTFEACYLSTITPITAHEFGLIFGGKANEAELELAGNIFYYWGGSVGGGKVFLEGKTEELKIWNTGLVGIDAQNLSANFALIENKSRGQVQVNVSKKLMYGIAGEGNIVLHSNPELIIPVDSLMDYTNPTRGKLVEH